jgi:hypothetical protein
MSDAARRVGDRGTVLIAAPFAAELAARLSGVPAGAPLPGLRDAGHRRERLAACLPCRGNRCAA